MVRKNQLPKFPDDYINDKAEEYDSSKWMERNQKRSTLSSIQYLIEDKLNEDWVSGIIVGDSPLILDLGCGTGFSSVILMENGFRVIGIDILNDMLSKAREKKRNFKDYKDLELVLADINYLPIKVNSVDHIISISSYNFITHGLQNYGEKVKLLNDTAKYLNKILKNKGRVVIEFYPKDNQELKIFNKSFINNGFEGFMVKNKPNQKSGQTFLLMKKC
ncbi:MAG: methyltransferase domain-containing protein [Promethearchaeota archaeon]|nr:MAG: methyltransferase domain-containing protein [Candidatus Lokiarchaeota archaeon]